MIPRSGASRPLSSPSKIFRISFNFGHLVTFTLSERRFFQIRLTGATIRSSILWEIHKKIALKAVSASAFILLSSHLGLQR
jgi:hypothetical protein